MMDRAALRENRDGCLTKLYDECAFSLMKLASVTGFPESTLYGWLSKHQLVSRERASKMEGERKRVINRPAGIEIDGDTAKLVSVPSRLDTERLSPEELMVKHGLDPADWDFTYRANSWDALAGEGRVTTLHQLEVRAKRRIPLDLILPARIDGPRFKQPLIKPQLAGRPIPLFSDAHAPYQDPGLESCALQWLRRHRPDYVWDLGDLMDWPNPSRHRPTRGFEATPNECVISRYEMDRRRRDASPKSVYRVLKGNHDERPEHAIVDKLGRPMAALARAHEALPVWNLAYILRYDELGIELISAEGEYHATTVEIVPGLFARHGTKAGKHGGAVKAIERRDSSLAQGHDHKGILHLHVRYGDDGEARLIWSISVMAMCLRELESTYMEDSDTAQGFTTITLHQNGRWHPEQAVYDSATKTLTWRDEIYCAAAL